MVDRTIPKIYGDYGLTKNSTDDPFKKSEDAILAQTKTFLDERASIRAESDAAKGFGRSSFHDAAALKEEEGILASIYSDFTQKRTAEDLKQKDFERSIVGAGVQSDIQKGIMGEQARLQEESAQANYQRQEQFAGVQYGYQSQAQQAEFAQQTAMQTAQSKQQTAMQQIEVNANKAMQLAGIISTEKLTTAQLALQKSMQIADITSKEGMNKLQLEMQQTLQTAGLTADKAKYEAQIIANEYLATQEITSREAMQILGIESTETMASAENALKLLMQENAIESEEGMAEIQDKLQRDLQSNGIDADKAKQTAQILANQAAAKKDKQYKEALMKVDASLKLNYAEIAQGYKLDTLLAENGYIASNMELDYGYKRLFNKQAARLAEKAAQANDLRQTKQLEAEIQGRIDVINEQTDGQLEAIKADYAGKKLTADQAYENESKLLSDRTFEQMKIIAEQQRLGKINADDAQTRQIELLDEQAAHEISAIQERYANEQISAADAFKYQVGYTDANGNKVDGIIDKQYNGQIDIMAEQTRLEMQKLFGDSDNPPQWSNGKLVEGTGGELAQRYYYSKQLEIATLEYKKDVAKVDAAARVEAAKWAAGVDLAGGIIKKGTPVEIPKNLTDI